MIGLEFGGLHKLKKVLLQYVVPHAVNLPNCVLSNHAIAVGSQKELERIDLRVLGGVDS